MINPLHTEAHTMMTAVHSNRIDVVKQHLPNVHSTWEPNEVFCYACQKGRLEIVQLLLPFSDTNTKDGQPLRLATGQGHYEVVKYILPHCDATLMRSDALQLSVVSGEPELFELLYPYSDCAAALEELNDSIQSLEIYGEECLTLRDRLAEIVASQKQNTVLTSVVQQDKTIKHTHKERKI